MSLTTMLMDGIPHGYCLAWKPSLLWLHATSDAVVAAAYFVIPISLVRFIRQRRDVPFNVVFVCFGLYILLCGTTHLLSVYNIWVPNWWLSGIVKALTAIASVATAALLVHLLPQAIALPSPTQLNVANTKLEIANAQLHAEAHERLAAQAALARAREDADELVRVRTSELAAANARLRHGEARYLALVQAKADIIWTALPDGTPADMDEWSAFTGLPPDRVQAEYHDFLHPDDAPHLLLEWQRAIAEIRPFTASHRLRNRDGKWRQMKVYAVPVLDDDGAVREWVGSLSDITAQLESERQLLVMQEQLQQAQRLEAVGRLAGGIAHDFNNLLTVITGASTLVLDEMPAEHPWRRDVEDVVAAGTRAAALTAQLLAYSRKQVMQPRRLDVHAVLLDVHAMLRRLIGEQNTIDIRGRTGTWRVLADPNQLEQVILNLALNARDAMPQGGTITFEMDQVVIEGEYSAGHLGVEPGEYVMLAVSDTGIGMDEATRMQIFEPFFTTKRVGEGTGLGLATVYGIIRQSGGQIYVYSEPGIGTTFKIYLPRQTGDATDDALPVASPMMIGGKGEIVLLVEDAADVRNFVARVLTRAGYEVLVADGSHAALTLLATDPRGVDLLLSDVIMPGMNGRKLADAVTALRPEAAVLFMSGYTDSAIVHHGVLDAFTNFVHKPFTPDQLLAEVRRSLEEHARRHN